MRCADAARRLAASGILSAAAAGVFAAAPKAEILGVWRGESLCVKSAEFPARRDESVEYDVYDAAGDAVHLSAYKFVGGEKVLMGEMNFMFDAKLGSWSSEFRTERYHGRWTLTVARDSATGTLVDLPSKHKVRDVLVKRDVVAPK